MSNSVSPRQLMELFSSLAGERIESSSDKVRVVITGNYRVVEVKLKPDEDWNTEGLEQSLVTALNDALLRVSTLIGKRVKAMG